jgi:hypothetical protein
MEKYWQKQSALGTFATPWGSTTTDTITLSNSPQQLIDVSEGVMILRFQFSGIIPGTAINVGVPAIAFFSQLSTNITYYTKDGTQTIDYSTLIGRGDVGYALQLIRYSQNSYTNNKIPMLLSPPNAVTSTQWEMEIPFKFLHDWAADEDKLLPIKTLQVQYSWIQLLQAFTPPLSSPAFNCSLLGIDYVYPIVKLNNFSLIKDPEDIRPPSTRLWTFQDQLPSGSGIYSKTVGMPGIPTKIYFFMLNKTLATSDGTIPVVYNQNPNDASIVNSITITAGDRTFPIIPQYFSINNPPTAQTNIIRHYVEQQQINDNWENDKNSFLDFSTWLTTNRIYAVHLTGLTLASQLLVNITFATPTTTNCLITFFAEHN